jgi:GWxTD domain-containing protein
MKCFLGVWTLCVCSLFTILLTRSVNAQKLDVSFDYAAFRYDSVKTYVDFYYSFNGSSLHFVRIASKDSTGGFSFADSLLFNVSVRIPGSDSAALRQVWEVPVSIPDTTPEYLRKSLVGKIDFVVLPGKYELSVSCKDVNNPLNNDSLLSVFPVPSYDSRKLESSEIELCSTISQGESGGIFYKNTYNVVPNPSATYGAGMPIIYYYLEVYNIPDVKGDSSFTSGYEIRDSFGRVRKTSYRTRKKFGTSSVEVGTVNGSNLKTGAYTFSYTVVDSAANSFTTSSRRFFVYNPGLGKPEAPDSNIASAAILPTVYAAMGEQQLDNEFAEARYVSTSMEKDQYKELSTIDSKRQFLYEFWEKRNSDQVSKSNDTRTRYLERVAYANDHFRTGTREGWKTDRGRVYIIYGTPDEIDRHPNETDSKPYEVWYYNSLEGGVSFDFVDRTGYGDYSLVNSTERNEIHDDNWQQYLAE